MVEIIELDSPQVEYDSIEWLQIVCPECGGRIWKVEVPEDEWDDDNVRLSVLAYECVTCNTVQMIRSGKWQTAKE